MVILSFIIPAYNEAECLERNIKKLNRYLESLKVDYEIVIAEDGSTDGSDEIAERLSHANRIRHVHCDERLGKGGAIKNTGKHVLGKYVIFMDADLSVKLDHVKDMIKNLKYDIVIGSRYLPYSISKRRFRRYLSCRIYNISARLLFPRLGIKDTQCGFKGFRKNVFDSINRKTKSNSWDWDLEFLLNARKHGFTIKEMPVEYSERDETRFNLLREGPFQLAKLFIMKINMFTDRI
jgi:glycosyltransferase involved in cell wall biosynthesis